MVFGGVRFRGWIAISIIVSLLVGCGPKVRTTLVQSHSLFQIRLVHEVGKDGEPIDTGAQHPISLSGEEVATLLRSINLEHRKGFFERLTSGAQAEDRNPFSAEEAKELGEGISKALSIATSAHRVYFKLRHPRGILAARETIGTIYVKDNQFIIFLSKVRYIPTIGENEDPYRLEDMMGLSSEQNIEIKPGPYQKLHLANRDSIRKRWLAMDYQGLLQSASSEKIKEPRVGMDLEERVRHLKRWHEEGLHF